MSLTMCRQYCHNYTKCCHVIILMDAYRNEHGEPCPFETVMFAEHQVPACIVPRPEKKIPGRDYS